MWTMKWGGTRAARMDELRTSAQRAAEQLAEAGRTGTAVFAIVGLVAVVALVLAVTALARTGGTHATTH